MGQYCTPKIAIVTTNANGQGVDFGGQLSRIHWPKPIFELVQAIE